VIFNFFSLYPGDVPATSSHSSLLPRLSGFWPGTDLATGLRPFVDWYRDYYRV